MGKSKITDEMRQEKKAFMDVAKGYVNGFTFQYTTREDAIKAAHRLTEYRARKAYLEGVQATQIIRRKNVLHLMQLEQALEFDKQELYNKKTVRKSYLQNYYKKRKAAAV